VNAEAFASAAVDPGELTFVYGSTISTLFILSSFKRLAGFLTGPSLLAGTYRAGGATSSGGRYLDWIKGVLKLGALPSIPSISTPSGLLMVPYLDGARTPNQEPKARVAWYGMDSSTSPEDLCKGAMEAMGYELSLVLGRLSEAAPLPSFIHAMGGLASNHDFLQIVSNVTGMPHLHLLDVDASYGDALMAISADLGMETVRSIWKNFGKAQMIQPDPEARSRYLELLPKYALLNTAVLELT
jgi:xylulokinase